MIGPWNGMAARLAGFVAVLRERSSRGGTLPTDDGPVARERDLPGLQEPGPTADPPPHPEPAVNLPPAAILAIHVNGLAEVTARYGEVTGRRALREVVRTVRGTLRSVDTFRRSDSDRLVAVLPGMTTEVVGQVALRVQRAVASLTLVTHSGEEVQLGVTVGRAAAPGGGVPVRDLHRAAEQDLEGRWESPDAEEMLPGERLRRSLPPSPN
ncbi:MAG: diguanylate cyclase [Acidobacteriota bacterium]